MPPCCATMGVPRTANSGRWEAAEWLRDHALLPHQHVLPATRLLIFFMISYLNGVGRVYRWPTRANRVQLKRRAAFSRDCSRSVDRSVVRIYLVACVFQASQGRQCVESLTFITAKCEIPQRRRPRAQNTQPSPPQRRSKWTASGCGFGGGCSRRASRRWRSRRPPGRRSVLCFRRYTLPLALEHLARQPPRAGRLSLGGSTSSHSMLRGLRGVPVWRLGETRRLCCGGFWDAWRAAPVFVDVGARAGEASSRAPSKGDGFKGHRSAADDGHPRRDSSDQVVLIR